MANSTSTPFDDYDPNASTTFDIPLGGYEEEKDKVGLLLEPGVHQLKIMRWHHMFTEDDRQMLIWTLEAVNEQNPDFNGIEVPCFQILQGKDLYRENGFVALAGAAEVTWEETPNQDTANALNGRVVEAQVGVKKDKRSGEDVNNVVKFIVGR